MGIAGAKDALVKGGSGKDENGSVDEEGSDAADSRPDKRVSVEDSDWWLRLQTDEGGFDSESSNAVSEMGTRRYRATVESMVDIESACVLSGRSSAPCARQKSLLARQPPEVTPPRPPEVTPRTLRPLSQPWQLS
eukprot:3940841-Rhodomonas_salina.5